MNWWKLRCITSELAALACFLFLFSNLPPLLAQNSSDLQNNSAAEKPDFARDVLPIFEQECFQCHGPEKQESNYRLDVRSIALGTSDLGDPPIVPGKSAKSPLFQFISGDGDLTMPPEDTGRRLRPKQIAVIRSWIDQGADWPDENSGETKLELTTDHWSFQPLAHVEPPIVDESLADVFPIAKGIDQFVARGLSEHGLRPSTPADRATLIRRIYLDMHGLHPTPEQVQKFVNESAPDACDKLIEEVLASQHYGESWARHWLDVVRFGESTGYEVNRDRANAYYYRDYVIDAFNNDKSYRDFVIEQLAGDAVGVDEATGFLVGGAYDIVKSPDINLTLMQRQDELADYVNTTATTFLGLTIGCARCHNHKFDPILQRDYYAFQAVFAGVQHGERTLSNRASQELRDSLAAAKSELQALEQSFAVFKSAAAPCDDDTKELLEMVNAKHNVDSFDPVTANFLRFTILRTNQSEPCLDELEVFTNDDNRNVALAANGGKVTSSGDYANDPKHQLQHLNDGKYGNEFSWISNTDGSGWVQVEFSQSVAIGRVEWGRERNGAFADRLAIGYAISVSSDGKSWQEVANSNQRRPFLTNGIEPEDAFIARLNESESTPAREKYDQIQLLRKTIVGLEESIPKGYVGTFNKPEPTYRLYRGDPMAKRELVSPDVLTVMGSLNLEDEVAESAVRLRLAKWIVSPENPLAARVIVNRVWQYHFGRGLVSTPSDFGKNGVAPSHPELLDWLALRFMENGWSLKWLHRQILSSSTYQQSSRPRPEAIAQDADCRWLWRFPPRRLEAEAIRDCILQLSDKLNPQAGGPGFLLFKIDRENVHHYFPLEQFEPEHFRRMIYMTKIRQEQDDVFGAFDCPDGGQTAPNRTRSTTALQSLNLLNSRFMIEQATFLANRLTTEAGSETESQVRQAYTWAFSRPPELDELSDAVDFVRQYGLEAFCRALLNTNEFLFLS